MRYNPPPGWPSSASEGSITPEPGWQPDPSWPPLPPGWHLWVSDDQPVAPGLLAETAEARSVAVAAQQPDGASATHGTQTPLRSYPSAAGPSDAYDPRTIGTTNGLAIASLVLGIMGGAVLGAIFGIVALGKIRDTGQKGRGIAIAGIVLSGVWVVVVVVAVVAANLGHATRAPNGSVIRSGSLSVHSLAAGDCFDWPADGQPLNSVTAIPCGQAHTAQVYAIWDASGASYPSNMSELGLQGCRSLETYLSASARSSSSLRIAELYPAQADWALGDRKVNCVIVSSTSALKSSLVNS